MLELKWFIQSMWPLEKLKKKWPRAFEKNQEVN